MAPLGRAGGRWVTGVRLVNAGTSGMSAPPPSTSTAARATRRRRPVRARRRERAANVATKLLGAAEHHRSERPRAARSGRKSRSQRGGRELHSRSRRVASYASTRRGQSRVDAAACQQIQSQTSDQSARARRRLVDRGSRLRSFNQSAEPQSRRGSRTRALGARARERALGAAPSAPSSSAYTLSSLKPPTRDGDDADVERLGAGEAHYIVRFPERRLADHRYGAEDGSTDGSRLTRSTSAKGDPWPSRAMRKRSFGKRPRWPGTRRNCRARKGFEQL